MTNRNYPYYHERSLKMDINEALSIKMKELATERNVTINEIIKMCANLIS